MVENIHKQAASDDEKHYTIDDDYMVKKAAPPTYGAAFDDENESKNLGGAGQNKEKITLTVNTFKKFCLKANTKKADKIHEYYIKLEELLHETVNEETNELREQLEGNHKRIRLLENRILVKQTREKHKERNVIYMVQDEFHKRDRIYVLGKAINITDRVNSYNKTRDHEIVYYRECNIAQQMALIETCVLYKLDKYKEVSNRDRFYLPEDQDISLFINVIDLFINSFDDVGINVDIDKDLSEEELLYKKHEAKKEYYEDNKEYILLKNKDYIEENIEKYDEYHKNYCKENKEVLNILCKNHYQENKEEHAKKCKEYRSENKKEIALLQKNYYEEHKDEFTKYKKEYYEQNKESVTNMAKEYYKEHKDEVLIKTKEHYNKNKVQCDCGSIISQSCLIRHINSKIHKTSIKLKEHIDGLVLSNFFYEISIYSKGDNNIFISQLIDQRTKKIIIIIIKLKI